MKSHVVIFNRSALQSADGWIHIVPKGELPNREAGIVQVLDDQSLDAIMAGISRDHERLGDKWPGIYAGREHFIYHPDQDSAALAWFKEFQKRDDGIWAKDDGLTNVGSEAVKNRLYKFTSFVADRGDLEKMDGTAKSGLPRYRVNKIETVGFTNQANGRELLTPITNRSSDGNNDTNDAALSAINPLWTLKPNSSKPIFIAACPHTLPTKSRQGHHNLFNPSGRTFRFAGFFGFGFCHAPRLLPASQKVKSNFKLIQHPTARMRLSTAALKLNDHPHGCVRRKKRFPDEPVRFR